MNNKPFGLEMSGHFVKDLEIGKRDYPPCVFFGWSAGLGLPGAIGVGAFACLLLSSL